MKGSVKVLGHATPAMERAMMKTAFLSYYISMYNTVNEKIGYENSDVSVDEIYDFLQDLRYEGGESIPDIRKEDIRLSFHILHMLGICKNT